MKYLVIRNEKSITEVADKVYKNLKPAARKRAEGQILKANPQLKSFRSVRKGYIVRVPEVHELGERESRDLEQPVAPLAMDLQAGLKRYEQSLVEKFDAMDKQHKRIPELLKAANKDLKKIPNGEEAARALKSHITQAKKDSEKQRKLALEALQKLRKTAEAIDR